MNKLNADVAIIGGGAIGMCAAYYLALSGAKVVIVDRGQVGHGSSLRNAGYISPSHFVPLAAPGVVSQGLKWMFNPKSPLYIPPRLDRDFLSWAISFARAANAGRVERAMPLLGSLLNSSKHLFEQLEKTLASDFHMERKGLAVLFQSKGGEESCHHEAALASRFNLAAEIIEPKDFEKIETRFRLNARGALYFPGDMHLRPELFVAALAADLASKGVHIIQNAEARFDVERGPQGTRITALRTATQAIQADSYVLAGGAWSPESLAPLGIKLKLQAGKGYSITVERPSLKPSMTYIFHERRVAITPFQNALRFAGTMEFAGLNQSINPVRVNAILDAVPLYFQDFPKVDPKTSTVWAGLRPVSPDGLPYLGRSKQIPNLIVAAGHAMLGISLAPITGSIVKDLYLRQTPDYDLGLLCPNRYD